MIKLTSYELKKNVESFTRSVGKYNENHTNDIIKLQKINSILENSNDTLLIDFLKKKNEEIIRLITKLDNDVNNYEQIVVGRVNSKIHELEEQELLAQKNKEVVAVDFNE